MTAGHNGRWTHTRRTPVPGTLWAAALLAFALCPSALCKPAVAAAHAKPPQPLNGAYQLSGLRLCGNSRIPTPSNPSAPTLMAADPPGWQQGTPVLANTPNPAAPESLLQETAVEWGEVDMAKFRSEIGAPGAFINDSLHTGPTWFFVTQYGFGDGVALDTVTTGYALYVWKEETDGWLRYLINLNSKLSFTAASASGHAAFQREINGIAYYCLRQIQLHQ